MRGLTRGCSRPWIPAHPPLPPLPRKNRGASPRFVTAQVPKSTRTCALSLFANPSRRNPRSPVKTTGQAQPSPLKIQCRTVILCEGRAAGAHGSTASPHKPRGRRNHHCSTSKTERRCSPLSRSFRAGRSPALIAPIAAQSSLLIHQTRAGMLREGGRGVTARPGGGQAPGP